MSIEPVIALSGDAITVTLDIPEPYAVVIVEGVGKAVAIDGGPGPVTRTIARTELTAGAETALDLRFYAWGGLLATVPVDFAPEPEEARQLVVGADFVVERCEWSPAGQTATFSPVLRFPGLPAFDAIEYSASTSARSVWTPVEPHPVEPGAYVLASTSRSLHLFTRGAPRASRLRFRWRAAPDQEWSVPSEPVTVSPPAEDASDRSAWLPTEAEVANAMSVPVLAAGGTRTTLYHYRVPTDVGTTGTEKQCIVERIYSAHVPTVWAVAAYAGDTRSYAGKTPAAMLADQLDYWGNASQTAPAGQGGYNAQFEAGFVAAVTIARMIPAVWDARSKTVQRRLWLAMLGESIANAFVASDACPFTRDWGAPGSGGSNKRTLRGYTAGRNNAWNYSGPTRLNPFAAAQFFRANGEDLQTLFDTFDQAKFAAECAEIGGLDHLWRTFRRRWTRAVQDEEHGVGGGGPVGDGPTAEQILGAIKGTWKCHGVPLADPASMFRVEGERFFSRIIQPGVPQVSPSEWPGAETDDLGGTERFGIKGDFTNGVLRAACTDKSTWRDWPNRGKIGMADELHTGDAGLAGGGGGPKLRSSMEYVQQGFGAFSCLMAALVITGAVDKASSGVQGETGVRNRIIRGTQDMQHRDEHGHADYSKGGRPSTNNNNWNGRYAESRAGGGFRLPSRYCLTRLMVDRLAP